MSGMNTRLKRQKTASEDKSVYIGINETIICLKG